MTPIDFGGGMIFPSSYGRDQFSAQQEREMEAGQAADEARAELSADAHEEALWAAARVEHQHDPPGAAGAHYGIGKISTWEHLTEYQRGQYRNRARLTIDAYLETLNAH